MITDDEMFRLLRNLDRTFVVNWRDVDCTYDPDTGKYGEYKFDIKYDLTGEGSDEEIKYPRMTISTNAESQERREVSPLDYDTKVRTDRDRMVQVIESEVPVFDEIVFMCSVDDDSKVYEYTGDDGTTHTLSVPARARAQAFAKKIRRFFRLTGDSNSEGPDGERPIKTEVVSGETPANTQINEDSVEQWQVVIRAEYNEYYRREVDLVESIAGDVQESHGRKFEWIEDLYPDEDVNS